MSSNLLKQLNEGKIFLSDGAMGTELQKNGLARISCPEECNFTHPGVVQIIHMNYFNAGSDIVQTNTFGANLYRLGRCGLSKKVAEINKFAAELARIVCPEGRFVFGSIGPTGGLIEPYGNFTYTEVSVAFREQAKALADGGVDAICVETMSDLREVRAAINAAKETGLPVIATMTFEKADSRFRAWGADIPTVVEKLTEFGADIIGTNCGQGFNEVVAVIEEMRPLTSKPIIAQPNAGIPAVENDVPIYPQTPEEIKSSVELLLKGGVNILGGCCGTGPAHIKIMRQLIDAFKC